MLWSSQKFGAHDHDGKALLNTLLFGRRSYDEHRNLKCIHSISRKLMRKDVFISKIDFGNKSNRGGLKHSMHLFTFNFLILSASCVDIHDVSICLCYIIVDEKCALITQLKFKCDSF